MWGLWGNGFLVFNELVSSGLGAVLWEALWWGPWSIQAAVLSVVYWYTGNNSLLGIAVAWALILGDSRFTCVGDPQKMPRQQLGECACKPFIMAYGKTKMAGENLQAPPLNENQLYTIWFFLFIGLSILYSYCYFLL